MRRLICTLLISFLILTTNAQLLGYEFQKPILISSYTETLKNCKVLYIPTKYAKSDFNSPVDLILLTSADIVAIDLVYTDYPAANSFHELNRNRFLKLEEMLSGINLSKVPVSLYRQNRASDRKEAEKDFHGFVIYYKKMNTEPAKEIIIDPPKELTHDSSGLIVKSKMNAKDSIPAPSFITDADFIKKLIDTDFDSNSLRKIKDAYLKPIDSTTVNYIICYDEKVRDYYKTRKMDRVKKYTKEEMLEKGYIDKSSLRRYKGCDDFFYVTSKVPINSPLARFFTDDSTVEKVLNRNSWNKMMVCADVTNSMTPYVIQLMVWLKLNANNRSLRYFTAFNDGDSTPDKKKKIGKTGGIYSTNSWHYIDVARTVYQAVNAGNGGDIAENVIEGLLDGQENSVDCENYVLIADNNAPVKDLVLLKKINKPIKIVLCGVKSVIKVDYLNIARKSGGSVHTIEDDITNLALMKEGEIFEFKGRQYKIKGGNFFDITVTKTTL